MFTKTTSRVAAFGRLLHKAGPYVVLEMVLPGGTLFALLLYLYRSGQLRHLADVGAMGRGVLRAAAGVFDQLASVWQPFGMVAAGDCRRERDGLEPFEVFSVH